MAAGRMASTRLYNGFPHERRWRNFGGYLVNTGTANKKAIRRVLESIPDEQWERLDAAVEEFPARCRPGLYDAPDS